MSVTFFFCEVAGCVDRVFPWYMKVAELRSFLNLFIRGPLLGAPYLGKSPTNMMPSILLYHRQPRVMATIRRMYGKFLV